MFLHSIKFILLIFILSSCTNKIIDIENYKLINTQKINIPESCKKYYHQTKFKVAVVNFTNNTSFQSTKLTSNNFNNTISVDINALVNKNNTNSTTRLANYNLSKAFIPKLEQLLLNTNNVELYTREDFNKINDELKLQDSGLINSNSIVKFKELSGVRYLVTGSIDYINNNFNNYSKYTAPVAHISLFTNNNKLQLGTIGLHLASSFFNGTSIKTAITVKILDVQTSKIIFSKQIKKETKINNSSKSSDEEIIGAVKNTINEALPSIQEYFNNQFNSYTYINQIKKDKDNNYIAQISSGKNNNIKINDKFKVYNITQNNNIFTNKKSCEIYETNIILNTTNIISDNFTYANISSDDIKNVKLYQLLKKIQE